ncbi:MAG TPA: gluconate 2-dehydrogenase subunit 3 family protein [Candidatus Binatia bacterium]|nr:gluconate 2-dehydrogenase subunit 3 family protein [Candidatus Binatia bacterium]
MSLAVALLLFLGAALAGRRFLSGYPARPAGARYLGGRELATVAAVASATYPKGGAVEPSGLEAGIPLYVDRFVAAQPPRMRFLMRCLFALVEHATLVFPAPGAGGRRRFSSLAPAQQVAVLDGWCRSRLYPRRLVFTSLRAILTMGYFADPAVLRELGLAPRAIPRTVCEADMLWPKIGERPESIAVTARDVVPATAAAPVVPLGPHGELHPAYAAPSPGALAAPLPARPAEATS